MKDSMASTLMRAAFELPDEYGQIISITSVRDDAILVTERAVFIAKPDYGPAGFSLRA